LSKKTISTILNAIMAVLTIGIVVLVVLIAKRGPKPTVTEEDLTNVVVSNNETEIPTAISENKIDMEPDIVCSPDKSSTSVNVRSGAGTDYERIGSAYPDFEYVVLSIKDNGWTEIEYDDGNGFISSDYLSYQYRYELGDGTYTYEPITDSIEGYKKSN